MKTESIEMSGPIDFDSKELGDPTSVNAGREFISKSGQDACEKTDKKANIVPVDQKMRKRRFQKIERMSDEGQLSLESTTERGHSPAKKVRRSCRSRSSSRVSCPTPKTTAKAIKPVRDSVPGGPPDHFLVNPAICKKKNGSRIPSKKHYCLYCKSGVIKIPRHLQHAHPDKPEVAKALSFPKGSKERHVRIAHLRNEGNFLHNVEVMKSGVGTVVPRKQPKDGSHVEDFLLCPYCQGLILKRTHWRHLRQCKLKTNSPCKPGRTRVQSISGFASLPPAEIKEQLWRLINSMFQDDVYFAVKSDSYALEYAEHLYKRYGFDDRKHEHIRHKLRELGRLLLCARQSTPLKTIQDHLKPANFMHVVQAVRDMAGYSCETNTFRSPSLALKIGFSLKTISVLVEKRAKTQRDYSAAKDARSFRTMYETRWKELNSSASLKTPQESESNPPQLLPFIQDLQTLHFYLDAQQRELFRRLSSESSLQTYMQLTKVTLTQVVLFNRSHAGEVSKVPLSAYLSPNEPKPHEDVALSELEKRLCPHFRKVEIRTKRGTKVLVLLTPAMQKALDLLVSKRQECGINPENTYLFARPDSLIFYRGCESLQYFSNISGAKSPENLTSRKLRKQTGTLYQVLNLTKRELDRLADILGHDNIRVYKQFYRLPKGTLQLAKISKILTALEHGRLSEFKDKSLDDISIDPEEKVHLDSTQARAPRGPCDPESAYESSYESDPPDKPMSTRATDKQTRPRRMQGRRLGKRKKWGEVEVSAVERHMMSFITTCRVPGKTDCDNCLDLETTALRNRDWLDIKFYVKNRITALRKGGLKR
ncbi:M-phase phosphoprotein 8 isoform X5 [Nerophis ophidion]|nr:M-phase phosphoprotein 8 isoform X5 [Nerophis ophidion]XP_061774249.1 M-phase phosphoprotein 8 isoform X5 [Nerophis ophidion]